MNPSNWRSLVVTLVLLTTGCSGGGTIGGNGSGSGGGTACPDVIGPAPTLVVPANGATNVSRTIGALQVAGQLSPRVVVTLTPTNGPALTQTDDVVFNSGSIGGTLGIPSLAQATTYTVSVTDLGPCAHLFNAAIGSFTTQ